MPYQWTTGLHVERIDDGYLVLVPDAEQILHLTDELADTFESVQAGPGPGAVCTGSPTALAALVDLDVIQADGWTRRRALQAGAAAAAAGVAVIALPSVAAAASAGTTTPTTPGPPVNLVVNPSFEDGQPGASVPSWTIG
ncbi:MAG TPA: hypothetical protein VFN21_11425 [Acidimicrobiales bacterium]|nr:hypothetical protein [Acidimicrobiales bacterium]